ncbi:hypothetical protein [Caldimonas caldifontis]|nr:hypothetical protein [Caldimonas caldifontis]
MSSIASAPPRVSRPALPWWREPMMWLVVGGPLLVILACAVTITLAIKHPDPVLAGGDASASAISQGEGGLTRMPAHQARNHTATPATDLPRDDTK